MPIVIRRANMGDLDVVVDFNLALAHESEGKTLDRTLLAPGVRAGLLDDGKIRYYVAELDGQVVGQMGVTFEWSDWRNGFFWWIQSVYVRPQYRRSGVFRTLYQHVKQAAAADPQVIGLRLYVEEENIAAQKTYESLGMTNTGYFVLETYPL